jgi:hypothetical protein
MHPTMLILHKLYAAARLALAAKLPSVRSHPHPAFSYGRGRTMPMAVQQVAIVRPNPCSFRPRVPIRPLRVVRVVESGQTRCSVGRMVISGRMADVCAELDRLVAHEASLR